MTMTTGTTGVAEQEVQARKLRVPAEEGQLSKVRDFIAECCEEAGFSTRETNNTKLAVDEACTNIIKHAYSTKVGDIAIEVRINPGDISVKLFDTGDRFDFAGVKDPDLDQYVETGRKGGLGVFLINRLMDDVQYRAGQIGNELIMRKSSHGAVSRTLPGRIAWRGTLRYKFTLRASLGLLALIAAIWGFVFVRQTGTIQEQGTTQWMEKRRLAENLAERGKALLLVPDPFSVEKTSLTAYISRMIEGDESLDYVRIVDSQGNILSSGNFDEISTKFTPPVGDVLLNEENRVVWSRFKNGDRNVRDIEYLVQVKNGDTDQNLTVGSVHVGVWEDAVERNIADPRFLTTVILIGFFLVGVFLIAALVSVFVKPIQVLTDGVRAIGQGSLDSKISVEGPAEIGAIAAVFNEITEKFKRAQVGVLEREKFQKEIEVAKQIQQALLPKKHPDISGYDIAPYYQAAKEVGGDYYDFVQVDEDTLGIVVADVSGKGVPGSLVMTMIRTALRMEARGNKNASDVMAKMNDFVTDDMKKGMFVTMFYVILDSKNRIISYASAGHNPMILYRVESDATFFLKPKGFPVGISLPDETLFRKSISLEKIKLKKDDILVIYTDGVTEAMNETREQYGVDRLVATIKKYGHLHPAQFIESLETDIRAFTGGTPQNDDITVVAIKEKLTADDVLSGVRKTLIDMVDLQGMGVKEACAKMKVSPATYYRYKKRVELMGERGLKNKVLREEVELKRVSVEERKKLIEIIKGNPEYGAKRITEEFNAGKDPSNHLTERMVYDELKRLGLNTREMRIDYLRRYQLYEEDQHAGRLKSREMVEDLLREVSTRETPADTGGPKKPSGIEEFEDAEKAELEFDDSVFGQASPRGSIGAGDIDSLMEEEEREVVGDLELSVIRGVDDVTVLRINGHLDSVSTTCLEQKINSMIAKSALKIVVDLSRVSYISSGGWGILVGEVKRLRETGGDIVLVGMMPEVYDVYELLGFGDILKALTDVEAARGYFRKPLMERLAEKSHPVGPAVSPPGSGVEEQSFTDLVKTDSFKGEWDSLRIEAGTVGAKGDVAVLSLAGIVDTVSAENLRQAIDRVIKNGIHKIVVDMSLVEYVSSGGWGTFTERLREVRRKGGDIKVFGMDPDVYYVFTMLGFNIVLSSFDILTEAIEDFRRAGGEKPSEHPMGKVVAPEPDLKMTAVSSSTASAPNERAVAPTASRPRIEPVILGKDEWVRWRESDGILVGALSGPIEAVAVERLDRELEPRLSSKPVFVLFDLGGVDYVSSTGWGLVAKVHQELQTWGGALALCRMNPDLYEIFGYLELQSIIRTYPTQEAALNAFQRRAAGAPSGGIEAAPVDGEDGIPAVDTEEFREAESQLFELDSPSQTGDHASVDEVLGGPAVEETQPASEEVRASAWENASRDIAPTNETDRTVWKSRDLDSVGAPDERGTPAARESEEAGEAEQDAFVDFPADRRRIDVDSAVTDDRLATDERLREIGWEQYGHRLKTAKKRRKKDGDEPEDETLP